MKRTENGGLSISLVELQTMLEYAKNRVKYDNMHGALDFEINNGEIEIYQYCCYAECFPINHSLYAKSS